ncbi:MAG TPA: heavy metal translocating P-type ATPase [Bryobacteraceae bacterium]|nr:heavy metal translocating P-type ATPase [Bryobacteraceae bacterium]
MEVAEISSGLPFATEAGDVNSLGIVAPATAAAGPPDRTNRPIQLDTYVAILAASAIAGYLAMRYLLDLAKSAADIPLCITLLFGGGYLLLQLARTVRHGEWGADLLAGVSIVASICTGEFLVGAIIVLMLSSGTALEIAATRRASAVLDALARRMPGVAHQLIDGQLQDVPLDRVTSGDLLIVLPHELCPADGVVTEGHGGMDESYLTGEPYAAAKAPGSDVLSGAVNGESALTIRASKRPVDSRYATIMSIVAEAESNRPRMRRISQRLGAWYTPLALAVATGGWAWNGDPKRFLAVLVIATPCPLLIAIPVAILGAISLAARRGIVVRNPLALERIDSCATLIFDKTGTLTFGRPSLTEIVSAPAFDRSEVLKLVASLEQYSRHPLAGAVTSAAAGEGLTPEPAESVSERPGEGLSGTVAARYIRVVGRKSHSTPAELPPQAPGLECIVLIDGRFAAVFRFRDEPRQDSLRYIRHLALRHSDPRVIILSGDRLEEVRYLAKQVAINEMYGGKSPEEKLAIVRWETTRNPTLYVGDGINDAPAMRAATVAVAFAAGNDIAAESADAVILEATLTKVDELVHIGRRMRQIALQSAIGGMILSGAGMLLAAAGYLPPIAGAVGQELIDLAAVVNALRVAATRARLSDV